jgi:hyperosmotically inducible periplasmic protein
MQRRMFRTVLVVMVCLTAALAGAACKSGPEDATITASVKTKVTGVPGGTGINVDTKDGVVTLNGTVDTEAAKASAEAAAKGVEGVKSVKNNLTVKAPPPAMPPAAASNDAAVQKAISDNLTKAGVTGVTVVVSNGTATLSGKVPKANWPKAMQAANEANPKPTKVQNSMTE